MSSRTNKISQGMNSDHHILEIDDNDNAARKSDDDESLQDNDAVQMLKRSPRVQWV